MSEQLTNKVDPVHAVTNMALALVEIQKDISVLHRKYHQMTEAIGQIDKALIGKFGNIDKTLHDLSMQLQLKGMTNASNDQRQKDNGFHAENLRPEEGEAGVLRNDSGGEADGRGTQDEAQEEQPEKNVQ